MATHQEVENDQETLQHATARAERAEAEIARLRDQMDSNTGATEAKQPPSPSSAGQEVEVADGEQELRQDSMMAHLLDSLTAGKDIGHYGRLVFAMIARHFLSHAEVIHFLTLDPDFSEEQAQTMLQQTEGRDYSPPRRQRLLEWQSQQEFPILPNPEDPDCGNVYRTLKFPQAVYAHIGHYQEQKAESGS